jgi:20S proteasome alpha/beta subunit
MTLILALEISPPSGPQIIVGADSRGVHDYRILRMETNREEKLIQMGRFCCILISGDGEVGRGLVSRFKARYRRIPSEISRVAKLFSKFCRAEYRALAPYHSKNAKEFPDVAFILVGIERNHSTAETKIFTIRSENMFFVGERKFYASDGSILLANYKISKMYEPEMLSDDAVKLVAQSIYDTTRVDGNVGLPINLAVIDRTTGFRFLSNPEQYFTSWEDQKLRHVIDD